MTTKILVLLAALLLAAAGARAQYVPNPSPEQPWYPYSAQPWNPYAFQPWVPTPIPNPAVFTSTAPYSAVRPPSGYVQTNPTWVAPPGMPYAVPPPIQQPPPPR
jgi:hypothetical protein